MKCKTAVEEENKFSVKTESDRARNVENECFIPSMTVCQCEDRAHCGVKQDCLRLMDDETCQFVSGTHGNGSCSA